MSATTTDNVRMTRLRHTLADYDLHYSQPSEDEAVEAPAPNVPPPQQQQTVNPPDWEDQWRRVPAYRPVNRDLLNGDRNQFNNAIERTFIRVMFGGVWLQAAVSQLWRSTGGKLNDGIFKVKIGGEW